MNDNSLNRFLEAQASDYAGYETALGEIEAGRKTSHWIWYIFPQLKGLGHSRLSVYYGIAGRDEAEAYLAHPVLAARLREITEALMSHTNKSAVSILGGIDAQKVQSCMTLFDSISPNDVFAEALDHFYDGRRDPNSILSANVGNEKMMKGKELYDRLTWMLAERCAPAEIEGLEPNEVFVFGSKPDGNHVGGAARKAVESFGAVDGKGEGHYGSSYAIPVHRHLTHLMDAAVKRFVAYAGKHPELKFFVMPVGCGTANMNVDEVADMFRPAVELDNVYLPEIFIKSLRRSVRVGEDDSGDKIEGC